MTKDLIEFKLNEKVSGQSWFVRKVWPLIKDKVISTLTDLAKEIAEELFKKLIEAFRKKLPKDLQEKLDEHLKEP